jgi:hypothetical protein
MGIFGPSVRYYEAFSASTTIFQAEMYAINVCVRICLNTEGLAGKHGYIMSDSQAALRALKSYTFTSKQISNVVQESIVGRAKLQTHDNADDIGIIGRSQAAVKTNRLRYAGHMIRRPDDLPQKDIFSRALGVTDSTSLGASTKKVNLYRKNISIYYTCVH